MKAVCFALVAVLAVCATAGIARETRKLEGVRYVRKGTCGDSLTWTLDEDTKILLINGSGLMYNYSSSDKAPWYEYSLNIYSMELQEGVKSIGNYAFYHLVNLSRVVIPNTIGYFGFHSFANCKSLKDVTIPSSVRTILSDAFSYCTGLKTVTIDDGLVTIGDYAFLKCTSLVNVVLPNSVKVIGAYAFKGCTYISSLTLPSFLRMIGSEAFANCSNLVNVTIPYSVTTFGSYAFSSCSKLKRVSIRNGVTTIGEDAFSYCPALESVFLPDSLTTIGKYAFYLCTNLTSVYIPVNVSSIGTNAFYRCNKLVNINVNTSNVHYSSQHGVLFNYKGTTLIRYPAGKTNYTYEIPSEVTTIGRFAFSSCEHLTRVIIPESVKLIPRNVFYHCHYLTSVNIPKQVTAIGQSAFSHCYRLASIEIPDTVTSIGDDAFSSCRALTEVTIPADVNFIGAYAFYGNAITSINIPASVSYIGFNAFYRCDSLVSITVDGANKKFSAVDGVLFNDEINALVRYPPKKKAASYEIPSRIKTIEPYAFSSCTVLNNLTISSNITSIGNHAFYYGSGIETITIPDGVSSIGAYAFSHCEKLKSVSLPSSLTSIAAHTFAMCYGLVNVSIPSSVKSIANYSFYHCTSLKAAFYDGTTAMSTEYAFAYSNSVNVCVPPGYESSTFCGKSISFTVEPCKTFRGMFNRCFRGALINGRLIELKRLNATIWEAKTNGCVQYQCDRASGALSWSLCNSSKKRSKMCLKGMCSDFRQVKGWSVVIGIHELPPDDVNISVIADALSEMTGLNVDPDSIGFEAAENGLVFNVFVNLDDEETAERIAEAVNNVDKGSRCKYSALCSAERVEVKEAFLSASGASSNHQLMLFSVLLIFIAILLAQKE